LFRNICLFRTLKLRINELNDLFTTLQQDLRTRSQACELVRTVLDEISQFLDSIQIQSDENEILSLTLIKNLRVGKSIRPKRKSHIVYFLSFRIESTGSIRFEIETFENDRFIFKSLYNGINEKFRDNDQSISIKTKRTSSRDRLLTFLFCDSLCFLSY